MEDQHETPEAAYRRGYQAGYAAALEVADAEKSAAWVFWEGPLTDWTLQDTDREILPPEFTTEGEPMNALDLIRKMFQPNEVMHPDPETLTAVVNPFTGDNYISLGKIDPPADWGPLGTVTRLHFEQESGGGFVLCFGFHKGNTYAWIENEDNPFDA